MWRSAGVSSVSSARLTQCRSGGVPECRSVLGLLGLLGMCRSAGASSVCSVCVGVPKWQSAGVPEWQSAAAPRCPRYVAEWQSGRVFPVSSAARWLACISAEVPKCRSGRVFPAAPWLSGSVAQWLGGSVARWLGVLGGSVARWLGGRVLQWRGQLSCTGKSSTQPHLRKT